MDELYRLREEERKKLEQALGARENTLNQMREAQRLQDQANAGMIADTLDTRDRLREEQRQDMQRNAGMVAGTMDTRDRLREEQRKKIEEKLGILPKQFTDANALLINQEQGQPMANQMRPHRVDQIADRNTSMPFRIGMALTGFAHGLSGGRGMDTIVSNIQNNRVQQAALKNMTDPDSNISDLYRQTASKLGYEVDPTYNAFDIKDLYPIADSIMQDKYTTAKLMAPIKKQLLSEGTEKELADMQRMIEGLGNVKSIKDDTVLGKGSVGLFTTDAENIYKRIVDSPKGARFQTKLALELFQFMKQMSGASIPEAEMKRYEAALPNVGDKPNIFVAKLEAWRDLVKNGFLRRYEAHSKNRDATAFEPFYNQLKGVNTSGEIKVGDKHIGSDGKEYKVKQVITKLPKTGKTGILLENGEKIIK